MKDVGLMSEKFTPKKKIVQIFTLLIVLSCDVFNKKKKMIKWKMELVAVTGMIWKLGWILISNLSNPNCKLSLYVESVTHGISENWMSKYQTFWVPYLNY